VLWGVGKNCSKDVKGPSGTDISRWKIAKESMTRSTVQITSEKKEAKLGAEGEREGIKGELN